MPARSENLLPDWVLVCLCIPATFMVIVNMRDLAELLAYATTPTSQQIKPVQPSTLWFGLFCFACLVALLFCLFALMQSIAAAYRLETQLKFHQLTQAAAKQQPEASAQETSANPATNEPLVH